MTSPSAASNSATTHCGRTTSRPRPAWRRSRTSPPRPRNSSSASAPCPSTDISRSGSPQRSTASGSIPRSSGSGSGQASCARRSTSSSERSPSCVNSYRRARIVVAAMRPRLCRLGGAIADGVLLNWMLPAQAAQARRWVHEGADEAGRAAPVVASYIRVAVGPGSRSGSATRRATTARSTTAIARISRPWTSRSGASAWQHRHDQQYSTDWRPTTPRSTFPSHACSQHTMRPRCSPSQMPRRPEARRPSTRTTTQEGSQIGHVRATTIRAAGITWPPPDIGPLPQDPPRP